VLAAGTAPAFISELATLLVASAIVAYLGHRLRLLPIVSFLIAGALIGPQALGLVRDERLIESAAEVGVILLLFSIGIEFSLAKLALIQRLIFLGGGLQVGLTVALVAGALGLAGVGWRAGVFTGFLVALSSTAIVMKLLMDRRETGTEGGESALGILIFQDLAVVAMVLFVPMLGGAGGSAWDLAVAFAKALGIVVLVLVAARRLMPPLLEAVARTCSQEIFVLAVVAICFGTAWATSLAGVSLSLGAFLAGLVVSESRFSALVFGEILPLQILFSAMFFVSVGLLLDFRFLMAHPWALLAAVGAVLLVKVLATGASLRLLGYGSATAAFSGLLLAQVGEFSFVLERTGRAVGLFPAGVENGGPQTFIATTVVLMMATPVLARFGARIRDRRGAERAAPSAAQPEPGDGGAVGELGDHVLVAGFGEAARRLVPVLDARGIPYLVLTLSPGGAREAEADRLRVLRGNYTRRHELERGKIERARLLVVADDDPETTRRVVAAARALNPDLEVVARVQGEDQIAALREAGASSVVAEEREGMARIVGRVLESYGVDPSAVRAEEELVRSAAAVAARAGDRRIRLSEAQRSTRACSHVALARPVSPSASVCVECVEAGDTWVHLRVCLTCGHVGCCDSSKNQHASRHHGAAGHPLVASLEPGEDWAWCYEDQTYL